MSALRKTVSHRRYQLGASLPAILLISLLSAVIVTAIIIALKRPRASAPVALEPPTLSEDTRMALQHLKTPVELRFYALLNPKTVSPELKQFAVRVDKLLSEYETEAAGKLQVQRFTSPEDSDAVQSASQDGVQAFNLQSGDACFLGIAVAQEDRRKTLPRLTEEHEADLEKDLTRAITDVATRPPPPAIDTDIDLAIRAAALDEVQRAIPEPGEVSLEQGWNRLREAASQELKATATEMQTLIQNAEKKLALAQANGSESDRQDALRELEQAQQSQAEKLKEITARGEAQLEAWEQIKAK